MTPVPALHVPGLEFPAKSVASGSYAIKNGKWIHFICPCGCGEYNTLPIKQGVDTGRGWVWDGNIEKPTLTPSIKRLDGCKYHGFLTNGIWTFCGDSGQ